LAPFYEKIIKPKSPQGLFDHLKLQPDELLLDVGGGTGRITKFASGSVKTVVVLDESEKMLRQAKSKDGLLSLCAASERIPFEDNSIDKLIMVDALHHVKNQKQTIAELWRVLKPGGRLIIEEPDIRHLSIKLLAIGEKLLLMRSHFLSAQKIEELFRHPQARIEIVPDEYNVWIIVEKTTGFV